MRWKASKARLACSSNSRGPSSAFLSGGRGLKKKNHNLNLENKESLIKIVSMAGVRLAEGEQESSSEDPDGGALRYREGNLRGPWPRTPPGTG